MCFDKATTLEHVCCPSAYRPWGKCKKAVSINEIKLEMLPTRPNRWLHKTWNLCREVISHESYVYLSDVMKLIPGDTWDGKKVLLR